MRKLIFVFAVFVFIMGCQNGDYKDLDNGLYADIKTDRGNMLLEMYPEEAPLTCANFITLAEGTNENVAEEFKGKRFFDGLTFHRVAKDFVIQGGDPLANGTGGPGYKFYDEFARDSTNTLIRRHDKAGVLSMANSGPATNGSQFFITFKPTPWLDGKHTVFGQIVKGYSVIDSIAPRDTIRSVNIVRIGSKAKKFNAVEEFQKGFEKTAEMEKMRLEKIEEIKKAFQKKMGIDKAVETESGLKILTLKEGKGKEIKFESDVTVDYALSLANGQNIVSTFNNDDRNLKFNLSKIPMITGFKEGVMGLKEGSIVRLFIPYYIGYGESGNRSIPPNSDLVFDVEVLKIGK